MGSVWICTASLDMTTDDWGELLDGIISWCSDQSDWQVTRVDYDVETGAPESCSDVTEDMQAAIVAHFQSQVDDPMHETYTMPFWVQDRIQWPEAA